MRKAQSPDRLRLGILVKVVGVGYLATLLVVATHVFVLSRLLQSPERLPWSLANIEADWAILLQVVAPLAAGTALSVWQALPLLHACADSGHGIAIARAKRVALDCPALQALIAIAGWMLSYAGVLATSLINAIPLSAGILLHSALNFASRAMLCGAIVYYVVDYIVRESVMPELFPDGGLSRERWATPLSIRFRFYVFFSATGGLPLILLYRLVQAHVPPPVLESFGWLPEGLVLGLLGLGAWLTWIVADGYQRPLVDMKRAVEKVRGGDYDVRLRVTSADELGALGDGINDMAAGLRDREHIKAVFGQAVDPTVRDILLSGNMALGGEMREATVMFSDIRGFTTLSESFPPSVVVSLLNRYFEQVSSSVQSQGGVVNKYIGDAVMAIFGVPKVLDRPADAAVRAALGIRQALRALNEELPREGLPPLENGIGIHHGSVLAGNIGSATRMEYTVIGDTVNIASRVQGLCRELKVDLILTRTVWQRLGPGFLPEYLTEHTLRGRREPVQLYTIR